MPRRREVPKRKIIPDPKHGDRLVAKFINVLMLRGKKSTAERVLYSAFDLLDERAGGEDPLKTFKKAIDNVKPMVEVKSRRVGGATAVARALRARCVRSRQLACRGRPRRYRCAKQMVRGRCGSKASS